MTVQSEIDLGLKFRAGVTKDSICAPLCTLWLMILTRTTEYTEERRDAFQL